MMISDRYMISGKSGGYGSESKRTISLEPVRPGQENISYSSGALCVGDLVFFQAVPEIPFLLPAVAAFPLESGGF